MDGAPWRAGGGAPGRLALEAMVWGRMPLAFSARCFTARHHRLRKDACEFRCLDYPDGLVADTGEGRRSSRSTASRRSRHLPRPLRRSVADGGGRCRLMRVSPHSTALSKRLPISMRFAAECAAAPSPVMPADAAPSNGYWTGKPAFDGLRAGELRMTMLTVDVARAPAHAAPARRALVLAVEAHAAGGLAGAAGRAEWPYVLG
jgi:hypothetical protein